MPHLDIAISGAGIAGPTLAYWLCRSGHRPILIEKAPKLRNGGYIVDFWGAGYDVAERMGIKAEVHAAGYSVKDVRIVNGKGRRTAGFSADVFRRMTKGRYTSLLRGDLSEIVYGAVNDRIETIFGDSIAELDDSEDGVCVKFEKSSARRFDLVIGADGLHSRVRSLAFGPEAKYERFLKYRVAAFNAVGYRPRDELSYVSFSRPGRQAARFALKDGRTTFLLIAVDEFLDGAEPKGEREAKDALRRIFAGAGWECDAILDAMEGAEDFYFDPVSQIVMDDWSKGRVALIGDAAACVSLLAGEGTSLAMTESYVLAGELAASKGDYQAAFARYRARLAPLLARKQASARKFAASFAPKTALGLAVRNNVTRLLAIPALADLFVGSDLRDNFPLPDYPFANDH